MQKGLLSVAFFIMILNVNAQEGEVKEATEQKGLKGTHRLSVLIGHSHLSHGIMENGKRGWTVIPSWGFDYDYWISNHWALGLQNDMMIESFKVETHEDVVIERTTPFSSIATVVFKPKEHVGFVAGMGGEFAKEENFAVTRLGIESGWDIKNKWEFAITLAYDVKWNGYDTWVIGIGISKLLKKVGSEAFYTKEPFYNEKSIRM
jgi:hypothetical protein